MIWDCLLIWKFNYSIKYYWIKHFNFDNCVVKYLNVQSFYLDQQLNLVLYSNRMNENLKCIQSNQISIDSTSKIYKCLILFHKFLSSNEFHKFPKLLLSSCILKHWKVNSRIFTCKFPQQKTGLNFCRIIFKSKSNAEKNQVTHGKSLKNWWIY